MMLKYWLADLADYADLLEIIKAQRILIRIEHIFKAQEDKIFSKLYSYFFNHIGNIVFFERDINYLFVHLWQYSTVYNFIADKILAP